MNSIQPETIRTYVEELIQKKYGTATIERKLGSVLQYVQWAYHQDHLQYSQYQQLKDEIDNLKKQFFASKPQSPYNEVPIAQGSFVPDVQNSKQVFKGLLSKIPFLGSKKHSSPTSTPPRSLRSHAPTLSTLSTLSPSLHPSIPPSFYPSTFLLFGLLIILASLLGAGIYQRFFQNDHRSLAYPSTPVVGNRILSFQGRLTDSRGNPIVAATNMRFRLYTAASGGTSLYDSGTCSVPPDQDGIHNVLIGSSCGAAIASSVFTENADVFLGVTVGSDAEMTPRQQVANVPYAMNAETLQGLPLGTNVSTVPYINQGGDLLIAAASPQIGSTYASETFLLSSANSVTIQSAGTGDITLTATGSGTIKFLTGGSEAAVIDNSGNLSMSNGNQFQLGNIASDPTAIGSGSLYYNTTNNKVYYYNGTAWTEIATGAGGGLWQVNSAALSPGISSYDVLTGSTATSSALVRLPGLTNQNAFFNLGTGNVGIGTTGPDRKLDVLDASNPQLRLTQADGTVYS